MYFPIDDILNNTTFGIPKEDSNEVTNIVMDMLNDINEK